MLRFQRFPDHRDHTSDRSPNATRAGASCRTAALVHAVAHIEFNAINLACDAVYRFRDLPSAFYGDWIGVAAEEGEHFRLLQEIGGSVNGSTSRDRTSSTTRWSPRRSSSWR